MTSNQKILRICDFGISNLNVVRQGGVRTLIDQQHAMSTIQIRSNLDKISTRPTFVIRKVMAHSYSQRDTAKISWRGIKNQFYAEPLSIYFIIKVVLMCFLNTIQDIAPYLMIITSYVTWYLQFNALTEIDQNKFKQELKRDCRQRSF